MRALLSSSDKICKHCNEEKYVCAFQQQDWFKDLPDVLQLAWMCQTNPLVDGNIPTKTAYPTCPFGPTHNRVRATAVERAEEYMSAYRHKDPETVCKIALLGDRDFMYMCGLRAFEIVRRLWYRGPFRREAVEYWLDEVGCLDGYVLSPLSDLYPYVRYSDYAGISGKVFVLPLGHKCPRDGCNACHGEFQVHFVLQVWLGRLTGEMLARLSVSGKPEYSHLNSQTSCINTLHALYELRNINNARTQCTRVGNCRGYGNQPDCLMQYAFRFDFEQSHHEMVEQYSRDILIPALCLEHGCSAEIVLYRSTTSSHPRALRMLPITSTVQTRYALFIGTSTPRATTADETGVGRQ
ncbi:uncharacterized protein RHO25_008027 [Cercospora beticola]|uniref:Uncharacterized protein n=1 Tax=Cercospora beticola TaxID=122368 RepID=A0ABZ0NV31_CERBT|nr:hypothetical protein RHO25_008027 [Cercospora beticola]